jgi:hypothetical protein
MAYEKGVKKATLDVDTKTLTVIYRKDKTTSETLRKAVTEAGYDADDQPANPKKYAKLPKCCRKDAKCDMK